jgi:hypothetical protein
MVSRKTALLTFGIDSRAASKLRHHAREIPIRQAEMLGCTDANAIALYERSCYLGTSCFRLESNKRAERRKAIVMIWASHKEESHAERTASTSSLLTAGHACPTIA